ncbi:hypothetical protein DEU56DRAFT_790426 [Suillus clintonianus]|uniref:uncharacterized protein n=1 Tax=Suillus clintonianus TaxID=1904413 RepID=UPI001B861FF1|nr:uncharacterized protein DEU56DRAFT_790426 [Suillus clintonianus]KAG2144579.1 hypothetical protein DEU56DRAFT_790426 [Suillus clintonianus]
MMKLVWCFLQSVFVSRLRPTLSPYHFFCIYVFRLKLFISFGSPDSRFLVRSLCTELAVVICDAANRERSCRARAWDARSNHKGSLVWGFFAR